MVTTVAPQAAASKVTAAVGPAYDLKIAIGSIPDVSAAANTTTVTTGPVAGDIFRMLKLPKGAVIVGGQLYGSRMSSGTSYGSSSLSFNVGFSGALKTLAGTSYGATSTSNALGFCNPTYAEVSGVNGDSGLNFILGGLLCSVGPLVLTEDQYAILTCTGTAVSFVSAASITLEIDYYMGVHA